MSKEPGASSLPSREFSAGCSAKADDHRQRVSWTLRQCEVTAMWKGPKGNGLGHGKGLAGRYVAVAEPRSSGWSVAVTGQVCGPRPHIQQAQGQGLWPVLIQPRVPEHPWSKSAVGSGPGAVPRASSKEAGASCSYTALGSSHLGTNQILRLIPPGVW